MDRDREMVWLDYLREGPEQGSLTKLERILDVTRETPQRRPWRSLSWWLPNVPTLGTPARLTVYLVLLMLLMLALSARARRRHGRGCRGRSAWPPTGH